LSRAFERLNLKVKEISQKYIATLELTVTLAFLVATASMAFYALLGIYTVRSLIEGNNLTPELKMLGVAVITIMLAILIFGYSLGAFFVVPWVRSFILRRRFGL